MSCFGILFIVLVILICRPIENVAILLVFMMLRYGQRLCSALLHDRYATRWRFFCNAKPFSSQHADVDVAKREEADDTIGAKVSIVDQTRTWSSVVRRPKTLTREPFIKNLFLGKFDTVSFILSYALFFFISRSLL